MSEEFIDDIIAANETPATNEADAAKAIEADGDATKPEDNAADKTESSSTADADAHKDDASAKAPGDTSVAPGDSPDVEELASQLGWNKDHKGAEAVNAATYILRSKDIQKTMKDHNKDLKNQLSGVQSAVDALKDHNERVYKADVKKLNGELATLKKEKKAAVELADVEKVEELDQQIEGVQKDLAEPIKTAQPSDNPMFNEWVADNGWYLTDKEMAEYADVVADQYNGAPPERVYALVREKVAEVFPDKFKEETPVPKVDEAKAPDEVKKVDAPKSPVEAGTRSPAGGAFSKADLSADQVSIMNQFVKSGIMTEDQYVADIAKLQGE